MDETDIICERRGAAGFVLLNRPKALNALTHGMVRALARALDGWERDAAVERVVVAGAGERAFCAGGDIRELYDLGKAGEHAAQVEFWREEYVLNRRIARYPKPYVALIDGFVMGGGVGVSIHGSHRVAGDRLAFAMPEVGIGFFPDVGGTYFLPRMPGRSGTWLALTGARIGAGDACALGLATSFASSTQLGELAKALEARGDTSSIIAAFSAPPPPAKFADARPLIDRCFGHDSVASILAALKREGAAPNSFARETLETLAGQSPTSLAIGLRQMREGAGLTLEAALRMELRIAARICREHDFYEGVRSVVIERDKTPRWRPASHEETRTEDIDVYFAPLGEMELRFAGAGAGA